MPSHIRSIRSRASRGSENSVSPGSGLGTSGKQKVAFSPVSRRRSTDRSS